MVAQGHLMADPGIKSNLKINSVHHTSDTQSWLDTFRNRLLMFVNTLKKYTHVIFCSDNPCWHFFNQVFFTEGWKVKSIQKHILNEKWNLHSSAPVFLNKILTVLTVSQFFYHIPASVSFKFFNMKSYIYISSIT